MRRLLAIGRGAGLWGAVALAVACAAPLSDTGFRGRWQRAAEAAQVSIWQDDTGWHFCWSAASQDAGPAFTCTEDGRTVMSERGTPTYRYDARLTLIDAGDAALVEIEGQPLLDGLTPIRWADRLELEPGGMAIQSRRVSLNGREVELPGAALRLVKVSDEPR